MTFSPIFWDKVHDYDHTGIGELVDPPPSEGGDF